MAAQGWGTNRPLKDFLHEEGHRFDFFQVVKMLELLSPERRPVGIGSDPADEVARFKSRVSMDFPPTEVHSVERGVDGAPPVVTVNFLGLAGATGPLPASYTDLILDRIQKKDFSARDFLDIFNHRLVSLLFRIRRKFHVGFETKPPEDDFFAQFLFSLLGLGTGGLRQRMRVKDRALPFYTGLVNQQPHSMAGLQSVLGHYFDCKVRGEHYLGRWYNLERDQHTRIGPSGQNQVLGKSAVLGTRVWDVQGNFRLHLGPLRGERFLDLLPVGRGFVPLCELTRFYVGREFDFDFKLTLRAEDVPESRLGGESGPRLGWTSWLKTRKFAHDDSQVRLTLRSGFFVNKDTKEI
jgi:type VI secretion system protein ImpH